MRIAHCIIFMIITSPESIVLGQCTLSNRTLVHKALGGPRQFEYLASYETSSCGFLYRTTKGICCTNILFIVHPLLFISLLIKESDLGITGSPYLIHYD